MGHHRVELISKDLAIPICPPQRPRHPDSGIAPDSGTVRDRPVLRALYILQDVWHNGCHETVRCLLLRCKILQPVAKEILHIEQVGGGGCEDCDVTGPSEALVPLWAIGGHVEEVAACSPDNVSMQLIEQLVGALELARTPQFRMNHNGTQCALSLSKGVNTTRPSAYLDIAEAMEGECWLEYVVAAAEYEAIGGLGAAQ